MVRLHSHVSLGFMEVSVVDEIYGLRFSKCEQMKDEKPPNHLVKIGLLIFEVADVIGRRYGVVFYSLVSSPCIFLFFCNRSKEYFFYTFCIVNCWQEVYA